MKQMIKIMEKNYFAAVEYRTIVALTVGLGGFAVWGVTVGGVLTGNVAGILAGLASMSMAVPADVFARRLGWPLRAALLAPFVFPALFYAILNSMFVTLRHGGVRWRDTFYPLETLRRAARALRSP